MTLRLLLPPLLLLAATAAPGQQRSGAADAASRFSLDAVAPAPAPTDAPPAAAPAIRAVFTLDTPIQDLIANPGAKAVLDKDLPGLSDDSNLARFQQLSLRGFQPMTGGQLTDAMLAKVAADLAALGGTAAETVAAPQAGNAKRDKDGSR